MFKNLISVFITILIFGLLATVDNPAQAQEAFDADAATEAYLATVPAEDRAKSDAYFEGNSWLILWGTLYAIGTSLVLLHFGFARKMRDWAEKLTRFKFIHRYVNAGQFLIATFIIGFPFAWYTGLFRETQYELATQTFVPWFGEQLIGLGLNVGLFGLAIALLYTGISRKPKTWWVWGGGGAALFILFIMTITPVFISPLFNEYKPLEEGEVRTEILSMARANQVPAEEIYWFDASEQTTRISANVSGMFGTTRISLNDNLLNGATLPEIRAVMAHEIAHYVTNNIITLVIPISLIVMIGFGFVHGTFDKVNAKFGARWGVKGIADPAGLPLLSALLAVFFFVMTPFLNTIIRENERMADAYALNAAEEPVGFATIALKLGTYRKLDPSPLEEFILHDHPSGRSRIQMAMDWKAENLGKMEAEADLAEE